MLLPPFPLRPNGHKHSKEEYNHPCAPAPASFETEDGIRIHIGIDYENIRSESIYIIYYIDVPDFENDFTLTPFHDWYVAVPKQD